VIFRPRAQILIDPAARPTAERVLIDRLGATTRNLNMRPWSALAGTPRRVGAAALLTAMMAGAPEPVFAQAQFSCQTIAADVQPEQPTAQPTVSGQGQYSPESRTSEQIIQQWATIQDPDPEACRAVRAVERRLNDEDEFARQQCPDVLPALKSQVDLARGEAKVACRGK
jgi:hypothetical protein